MNNATIEPQTVWQPSKEQLTDDSPKNPVHQVAQKTTLARKPKTLKPLTSKQKAFISHLVNNPRDSATKAVKATYNTTTDNSASVQAHDNLSNPKIIAELSKYQSKAEYNLQLLADTTTEYALQGGRDGASYAAVATSVNNSILDRLLGKATTRIEQQSTSVNISIDLTGVTTGVEE